IIRHQAIRAAVALVIFVEASNASGRKDLGHQRAIPVILTTGALATEGTDLGQLRVREAGSGL
ncbi:MAG: hypothetical protein WA571_09450, partial [Candidatus Binatus sp.]